MECMASNDFGVGRGYSPTQRQSSQSCTTSSAVTPTFDLSGQLLSGFPAPDSDRVHRGLTRLRNGFKIYFCYSPTNMFVVSGLDVSQCRFHAFFIARSNDRIRELSNLQSATDTPIIIARRLEQQSAVHFSQGAHEIDYCGIFFRF